MRTRFQRLQEQPRVAAPTRAELHEHALGLRDAISVRSKRTANQCGPSLHYDTCGEGPPLLMLRRYTSSPER